jgi:hypothetical protein
VLTASSVSSIFDPVTRSSERGNQAGDAAASNALGALPDADESTRPTTPKALGPLDHAPGETTPPATASNDLCRLDHALGETTPPATASKALGRLANTTGHDTTRTDTTSKALGRLADHAVRDILAHVRSLG